MYVPINAAIIVLIYIENKSKNCLLPTTLTEVYTQLCLTVLNKYMQAKSLPIVCKFEDLCVDLYEDFLELSKVAFNGFKKKRIIFRSDSVPYNLNHFGFLDAVPSLYGGSEISYNFLHLTLQEFFAACYISQLPDRGVALFGECGNDKQWNVVWRFVAGLTKFHCLRSYANCSSFVNVDKGGTLTAFFIQCLYEAQIVIDFASTFGTASKSCICGYSELYSPLDYYALGYCIAIRTTKPSFWNVECKDRETLLDSFFQGLMSNGSSSSSGMLEKLWIRASVFQNSRAFCIEQLYSSSKNPLLKGVTELMIEKSEFTADCRLSDIILCLPNLKKLDIRGCKFEDVDNFLKVLSVTSLNVANIDMKHSPDYITTLQALLHPSSGMLQELYVSNSGLVRLASSPSSLQHLCIEYRDPSTVLTSFNPNNQLKKLTLVANISHKFEQCVTTILKHSQTLEELHLKPTVRIEAVKMQAIATVLGKNTSLKVLQFYENPRISLDLKIDLKAILSIDPRAIYVDVKPTDPWNYPYI